VGVWLDDEIADEDASVGVRVRRVFGQAHVAGSFPFF
jgi:hypothetical protein